MIVAYPRSVEYNAQGGQGVLMLCDEFLLDLYKLKAVLAAMDTEVNADSKHDVVAGLVLVATELVERITDGAESSITCVGLTHK